MLSHTQAQGKEIYSLPSATILSDFVQQCDEDDPIIDCLSEVEILASSKSQLSHPVHCMYFVSWVFYQVFPAT